MSRKQKTISKGPFLLFIVFCLSFVPGSVLAAATTTQDDLKFAIDQKARELDDITKQIQLTQVTLLEESQKSKTIQTEVKKLDSTVQNVALGIQASQVTIDKLGLEIRSTQDNITASERALQLKHQAMADLLQSYQQSSNEGLLAMFMNNQTLAESLAQTQTLTDLNAGLLENLDQVRQLKAQLADQLSAATTKKKAVQTEAETLQAKKAAIEDQKAQRQALLTQSKSQQQAIQKQLDALQKQQEAISDEIGDIEDQLRAQSGTAELPLKRPGVFSKPVAAGVITQNYGATPYSKKLYKNNFHNGIDFGASIGTPVLAAADGIVFAAGNNGKLQYGRYIVLKHDNGLDTLYGHLSRQVVKTGDQVRRGDIIGYSGNTGYAFGPHLHFGVYLASSMKLQTIAGAGLVPIGLTLNPKDYL